MKKRENTILEILSEVGRIEVTVLAERAGRLPGDGPKGSGCPGAEGDPEEGTRLRGFWRQR